MKKILVVILAIVASLVPVAAASAYSNSSAFCSSNTAYWVKYRAVYEYPNGTYWQKQIAAFPAYYAKHNAQYQHSDGCN